MSKWILLLMLGAAVCAAATGAKAAIIVDGVASPAEWSLSGNATSPDNPDITDAWDIQEVWLANGANLYLRWDTYDTPRLKNDDLAYVNYYFEFTVGATTLRATALPTSGGGNGSDFYLEKGGVKAASTGKYVVGSVVEAYVPYDAFSDLGVSLPETFSATAFINNSMEEDDDAAGPFDVGVPEPATIVLLGLGAVGAWVGRRRN